MNNQDGKTALYVAAEKGSTEIVKLLLDKGANFDAAAGDVSDRSCML